MVAKGAVAANHIPVNNFQMLVGEKNLFFVSLTMPELETETIDLPDRTQASGGNVLPSEAVGSIMGHHSGDVSYLETWRKQGIGNVPTTYKRTVTVTESGIDGKTARKQTWSGVRIKKVKKTDKDLADPGAPAMYEYTFGIDSVKDVVVKTPAPEPAE
jgi:hypothetical protein